MTTTSSLRDLILEGLDELAGIERRFFRTAWQLLRRPGALTEEYREGRGGRYVSPVRMLLLAGTLWAVSRPWREEVPLGFRDVGVSYPTITLLAVPLFASALFIGYYEQGRPYSEYLTFTFYFQAAQLLLAVLLTPLPTNASATATLLFPVYYLSAGTHRLWGVGGVWSWFRAVFALVIYGMAILIAFGFTVLTVTRVL